MTIDHFTKWVEDQAICSKEALTVVDAVIQDWILIHGALISLHSDRGKKTTDGAEPWSSVRGYTIYSVSPRYIYGLQSSSQLHGGTL